MTINQAIDVFSYQANVVDYGISQGIKKQDLVLLFDRVSKLTEDTENRDLMLEIEKLIAKVAEQSFDEQINTMLIEIKMSIKELRAGNHG